MKKDFQALCIGDTIYSLENGLKGTIMAFGRRDRTNGAVLTKYVKAKNEANGVYVKFPGRENALFVMVDRIGWADK